MPRSLPTLADLTSAEFGTLVFLLVAFALFLFASGLERAGNVRRNALVGSLSRQAAAPVSHGTYLVHTARALSGAGISLHTWAIVLRADSLPPAAQSRVCGAAARDPDLAFVALSPELPACLAAPRAPVARLYDPGQKQRVRAELGGARWVILHDGGSVAYSHRGVPDHAELRRTLDVFHTRHTTDRP